MNEQLNVYGEARQERGIDSVMNAMVVSRQAQEVQAAMVVAKRFPRDEQQSADRILKACQRRTLAESAVYEYSRGGSVVTGPSIRLAEAIAQAWGNIDFGFIELEQRNGESQVMSYAWDLETNTRQSKIFSVPHMRTTKNGSYPLKDSRDIYEMVANQAARRVRSCILSVIPGDVIESAVRQCEITMRGSGNEDLGALIEDMATTFENEFGVTRDQLRAYIGKNVEAFSMQDVVRLKKVYRSLKDGVIGSDYFLQRMTEEPEPAAEQAPQEEPPARQQTAGRGRRKKEPEPTNGGGMSLDDL